MTNAAESQRGTAPETARSFTVPCTARWPIDPPGKRERRDHERVGAERQPLARRQGEHGPVAELLKLGVL